MEGLRAALDAAIDFGLAAIERGAERAPPIPAVLLTQARVAARSGVTLDTVLRRYFAGYALLADFLIEEAEHTELLDGAALKRLLRSQAALFDRLLAAVSEEHGRDAAETHRTAEKGRAEQVQRLLDGELVEASALAYDLDVHHLGLIAHGVGAERAIRELAGALDRRVLIVAREDSAVWAWLGGRRSFDIEGLERALASAWPASASLAIGEPARGFAGWRRTYRQAGAALPIALRSRRSYVRYGEVAVLASILRDDLLIFTLREQYLAPLASERDGGEALRGTLRAYLAAERNTTSTAAALGVSRQTVVNRLHTVEERLGRQIKNSIAELEAALQIDELGYDQTPYKVSTQEGELTSTAHLPL